MTERIESPYRSRRREFRLSFLGDGFIEGEIKYWLFPGDGLYHFKGGSFARTGQCIDDEVGFRRTYCFDNGFLFIRWLSLCQRAHAWQC